MAAEYSTALATTQQVSYLTQDHLGSPRVITDQNGVVTSRNDFGAFGDQTITSQRTTGLGYTPPNVRQDYTGYEKDNESGLEFAQARYYNPQHGRYTSVDPLTASATIRDPQTFNRYSYALNSPYKFTDPLGLIVYGAEVMDPKLRWPGQDPPSGVDFATQDYGMSTMSFGRNGAPPPVDQNPEPIHEAANPAATHEAGNAVAATPADHRATPDDEPSQPGQFNAESRVGSTWVGSAWIGKIDKEHWKKGVIVALPEALRQLLEGVAQWFEKTEMAYLSNVRKALAAGWDEAFVTNPAKKFWDKANEQKKAINDRLADGYNNFKQFVGQVVWANNSHPKPFGGPSPGLRLATIWASFVQSRYNDAVNLGLSTARRRDLQSVGR